MGRVRNRIIDSFRRQQIVAPRVSHALYYDRQSNMPQSIPRHTIAIIGSKEKPKWGVFECPCGTGHTIMLNLSSSRRPFWKLSLDDDAPSLSPSVDFRDSYTHCHFWLRRGRVHFTPDSRRRRRRRNEGTRP